MGRRKEITDEHRKRWALSAVRRESSIVSLSREAGVTEQTMHRWRDLFIEGGNERLSGGSSPEKGEIESLKKELAKRDQVIGEQAIAIRVLKKFGSTRLSDELEEEIMREMTHAVGNESLKRVLRCLGIPPSTWYRRLEVRKRR